MPDSKIKDTIEEVAFLKDAINTIGATISESLNKQLEESEGLVKRIGKTVERDVNRSFLNTIKGTDKVLANTLAISQGNLKLKDIQKQQATLQQKKLSLSVLSKQTTAAGLAMDQEAVIAAQEQLDIQERILVEQEKQVQSIDDKLGVTGKLLEGISKIPVLGGLVNSQAALGAAQKEAATDNTTRAKVLAITFKSVGKSIGKNLLDPLTVGTSLMTGIVTLVKNLDKLTSGTARNFGISNSEAQELNKELRQTGQSTGSTFSNVFNMNEAFKELNNRYGTFAKMNKEVLRDFTDLNKRAGISVEAVGSLQDLTVLNNKGLKETTAEFKGQVALQKIKTGSALNEAQVLEEIQNTSAAIKITLGGSASAIGEAVFKAKSLGVELKDLESISSSLLNFQSSIEDELSAELLTGKQLNLEGARYAALIGDQATLADELANNIGSAADFQAMNVIQQEAYGKAVGMSRDQLAQTLLKREALNKLDAEGNTLQEKYNNLKKQGQTDEQIAAKLGDESLARQMESTSNAEKLQSIMQSFQTALLPIAEKILPVISSMLEGLSNNMGALIVAAVAFKAVSVAIAAAQIAAAFAVNPIGAAVGAGLATAAIGGMLAATAIGDGDFPARGKNLISTKEGGLFQPSINDDIVVAPGASQVLRGKPGGGSQAIENKVSTNTNITLKLNGAVVSNTMARDNYKTGGTMTAGGGKVDYSAG